MTTARIAGCLRPVRCGILFLLTAACLIPTAASASSISLLNNGDFEGAVLPSLLRLSWTSSVYGQWAVGDPMAVVGTANGITPKVRWARCTRGSLANFRAHRPSSLQRWYTSREPAPGEL